MLLTVKSYRRSLKKIKKGAKLTCQKHREVKNIEVRLPAENSAQINRKFRVDFLGDSIANSYQSVENISNIV